MDLERMYVAIRTSCLSVLFIIAMSVIAQGQDKIVLKNGDKIRGSVQRVSKSVIEYKDKNLELHELDKSLVEEVYFGERLVKMHDYGNDRIKAFKWNPIALRHNALQLSYEKAISPIESYEITAKVYGISIDKFDQYKRGGALAMSYRYRIGYLLKRERNHATTHSLDGIGVKGIAGLSYALEREAERESRYYYAHFGVEMDYRLILGQKFLLEVYGGIHLFKGDAKVQFPNTPELEGSFDFRDGDLQLNNASAGFSYGLKLGYLFGSYSSDKKQFRWK